MSSQTFFMVNLGLGLLLVLIFLIGKKGIVAPSKLNLRKGEQKGPIDSKAVARPARDVYSSARQFKTDPVESKVKNLNVLFIYNGHTFDAYEVLGAPAGASLQMVQRYYQEAMANAGDNREFIEAAYFAIQDSHRS